MRKVLIVARHEYLVNVRRVGFIVMTALVPLMGAAGLLIAAFFGGQAAAFFASTFVPETEVIGMVDYLGAFTPVLAKYEETVLLFPDEETGRAAVEADEIASLLVIPEDYVESGEVVIVSKESGFSAAMVPRAISST